MPVNITTAADKHGVAKIGKKVNNLFYYPLVCMGVFYELNMWTFGWTFFVNFIKFSIYTINCHFSTICHVSDTLTKGKRQFYQLSFQDIIANFVLHIMRESMIDYFTFILGNR